LRQAEAEVEMRQMKLTLKMKEIRSLINLKKKKSCGSFFINEYSRKPFSTTWRGGREKKANSSKN